MSTLSDTAVATKAQDRLREGGASVPLPVLVSYIPDALQALAARVAYRDDFTELQKDVAVSCVNGVITLADDSVLLDTVPATGTLMFGAAVSKAKMRYEDLLLVQPKDSYYHAVRGRKIHVREITTGTLGTAGGGAGLAGTLTANRVPPLSELPSRYEQELVGDVVAVALGKMKDKPEGLNVNLNSNV